MLISQKEVVYWNSSDNKMYEKHVYLYSTLIFQWINIDFIFDAFAAPAAVVVHPILYYTSQSKYIFRDIGWVVCVYCVIKYTYLNIYLLSIKFLSIHPLALKIFILKDFFFCWKWNYLHFVLIQIDSWNIFLVLQI